MSSEVDRSSPMGLFNFARSYWQSGVLLHHTKAPVFHPVAPITLLLAHAIELYLKAFLRAKGMGVSDLKTRFGHDFRALLEEAAAQGLPISSHDKEIADLLAEQESIRRSGYIETGYYQRPSLAALSQTCRNLDDKVSLELRDAGTYLRAIELSHIHEE